MNRLWLQRFATLLISKGRGQQPVQFLRRVNIRRQGLWPLGHDSGQRRGSEMPPAESIVIEAFQSMVFIVPGKSDRAGAGKEGADLFRLNLGSINFRYNGSAKGMENVTLTPVTLAERLSPGNILIDQGVQFHNSPPSLKSATARSRVRS